MVDSDCISLPQSDWLSSLPRDKGPIDRTEYSESSTLVIHLFSVLGTSYPAGKNTRAVKKLHRRSNGGTELAGISMPSGIGCISALWAAEEVYCVAR
jgi:hypothetical protein